MRSKKEIRDAIQVCKDLWYMWYRDYKRNKNDPIIYDPNTDMFSSVYSITGALSNYRDLIGIDRTDVWLRTRSVRQMNIIRNRSLRNRRIKK